MQRSSRRPGIATRCVLGFYIPDEEWSNPAALWIDAPERRSEAHYRPSAASGFVGIPGRSWRWMGQAIGL